MKNLFDYATKELSQDAFIKWLVANYDDEEYGLKDVSLAFISFLMDKNNLSPLSKKIKIDIRSQINHMDIVIDIYIEENIHDVIVIEDKTFSSEHKQLIKYNESIMRMENVRNIYKVFYKIGTLTSFDLEGINKANHNQETKWRIYDIYTIYEFFKDKGNSKSQLLNDYVRYISHIKESLDGDELNDDISNWKYYEWEGYVKKYLSQYDNPINKNEEYLWLSTYQGKYVSIGYQRCLPSSNDAVVLEINIRGNYMATIFHHSFYDGKDESRKWAIKEVKHADISHCERLRNNLINYMKEISKENKEVEVVSSKRAFKCFGKFKQTNTVNNIDELNTTIIHWIETFIKIMDNYKD